MVAWFSAAVFFIYRVFSGYFIVDLSLKISCERKRKSDEVDYLAVMLVLKKGERGGVELHDAQARVRVHPTLGAQTVPPANAVKPHDPQKMISIHRLRRSDPHPWANIVDDWREIGHLNLPPGDEMQIAALFEVDKQYAYLVETVVLARQIFLQIDTKLGQWRATSVSLPESSP